MKKILISLMIGLFISACSSNLPKIETGNDIEVYVATDIHLLANDLMTNEELMAQVFEFGDGRFVRYTNEIMSTFTNTIKEKQPDILVLSGDLTHDGEKLSHEALAKQLKVIEKNGTRVFVVPGNHDLENAFAKDFAEGGWKVAETVSADEFEEIYQDYGYKEAISRDPSGLSYLAAPSDDVYLLMLDSNNYGMLNIPTGGGELTEDTLKWIREATKIARENNAQIITVMHHNLIKHSERLYKGYVINNSEEVVPIFDELNLNIVLSGHMHAQDIKYTEQAKNTIYDIVTSSMSIYPMNYGVVDYIKGEGFSYRLESLDVQTWAQSNSTDANLLSFDGYAKDMNFTQNYKRAIASLLEDEVAIDPEILLSDETILRLKTENFNGVIRQIKNELLLLNGLITSEEIITQTNSVPRLTTAKIPEQTISTK